VQAVANTGTDPPNIFVGWEDQIISQREDIATDNRMFVAWFETDDYIKIESCDDLTKIGNDVSYPITGKYKLVSDINAENVTFAPIGTATAFSGEFWGNGKKITNLTINSATADNIGLFAQTDGATIRGVTLEAVNITGRYNVGALVGQASGTRIENCAVTEGTVRGDTAVGGLVGRYINGNANDGIILTGSRFNGSIGNYSAGETWQYFGGLVGRAIDATVENCNTNIDINVKGACIGGLVGYASDININQSYSMGTVIGMGDNVGGLVGYKRTTKTTGSGFVSNIIQSYCA
jgi:hypothetical protein